MYIECKRSDCKYCFEGDCQLIAVSIDENMMCSSYEINDQQSEENKN